MERAAGALSRRAENPEIWAVADGIRTQKPPQFASGLLLFLVYLNFEEALMKMRLLLYNFRIWFDIGWGHNLLTCPYSTLLLYQNLGEVSDGGNTVAVECNCWFADLSCQFLNA